MKFSFVTIDSQGNPIYTSHLAFNDSIKSGDKDEFGNTMIEIPEGVSDIELLEQYVFSSAKGALVHIGAKPSPYHIKSATSEAWVCDIELAKRVKSSKIREACRADILNGFVSYALGEEFFYPYTLIDQQNLNNALVLSSIETNPTWLTQAWCRDVAGNWTFANHTAAQIQKVGVDGRAHFEAKTVKNANLQAQIVSTTTQEEIDLIVW